MMRQPVKKSILIPITLIAIAVILFVVLSSKTTGGIKLIPHTITEPEQDLIAMFSCQEPSALDVFLDVQSEGPTKVKIEVLQNVGNAWEVSSVFRPELASGDYLRFHTMKCNQETNICIHHKGETKSETFRIPVEAEWGENLLINSLTDELEIGHDPVAIALMESPNNGNFVSFQLDEYPERAPTHEPSYLITVCRVEETQAE